MLTATFTSVPSSIQEEIPWNEELIRRILDSSIEDSVCIYDTWPGIHFTLTGEVPIPREEALNRGINFPADPLEAVLMGGTPTQVNTGFGPIRFQTSTEVQQCAELLGSVSDDDFEGWFDADALEDEQIPPAGWTLDEDRVGELRSSFIVLRNVYAQAAGKGNGILIAFD